MHRFYWTTRGLQRAGFLQWAPTLTVHDPNPPITLESPSEDVVPISASDSGAGAEAAALIGLDLVDTGAGADISNHVAHALVEAGSGVDQGIDIWLLGIVETGVGDDPESGSDVSQQPDLFTVEEFAEGEDELYSLTEWLPGSVSLIKGNIGLGGERGGPSGGARGGRGGRGGRLGSIVKRLEGYGRGQDS